MATLDIFNNDAFSVSRLTQLIIDIPRVPTQLGDERLFTEAGLTTTTMMIERKGAGLNLVPAAPRGGVGQTVGRDQRKMIPIAAIHLPQRDVIMADEVQGVRAEGTEQEVESITQLVQRQATKMKANIDLTLEYHRVGALKGLVLDANGVDVIYDLYNIFGMTRQSLAFNINSASSTVDLKQKCIDLKRQVRNALGGRSLRRVRVKCSESWFDKFIGHNTMKASWERWNEGAFARTDQSTMDFEYAGVVFQVYSGGTGGEGGSDFIPADRAYAYPEGVPGMFQTWYAPGDYMSTVNRMGVPYYMSQERMAHDKGVNLESQSNPLTINTLPEAVIELKTAAT
jgi:hypothetical protein